MFIKNNLLCNNSLSVCCYIVASASSKTEQPSYRNVVSRSILLPVLQGNLKKN